jgi:hypothetical protein
MRASDVRQIALALPEAQERETWGAATFRVRDKIFVTLSADGKSASVKARKEHQQTIIASDPRTFSIAPYVGQHGWVSVRVGRVRARAMRVLIVDAWRLTAPKRTVLAYEEGR